MKHECQNFIHKNAHDSPKQKETQNNIKTVNICETKILLVVNLHNKTTSLSYTLCFILFKLMVRELLILK